MCVNERKASRRPVHVWQLLEKKEFIWLFRKITDDMEGLGGGRATATTTNRLRDVTQQYTMEPTTDRLFPIDHLAASHLADQW
uniref:Uncharacterized protein n=1 Tax=Setaria digitata TaxID=48799 RepID=A0A915PTT3_9BILA